MQGGREARGPGHISSSLETAAWTEEGFTHQAAPCSPQLGEGEAGAGGCRAAWLPLCSSRDPSYPHRLTLGQSIISRPISIHAPSSILACLVPQTLQITLPRKCSPNRPERRVLWEGFIRVILGSRAGGRGLERGDLCRSHRRGLRCRVTPPSRARGCALVPFWTVCHLPL